MYKSDRLLTECRLGEIRRLRWCEVKPDRLALIYGKTEPRHVLLGEAARERLDGLAETASGEWVFPGKSGGEPLTKGDLYSFWIKARDAAVIVADARLHDLRLAHSSHAVLNGECLHVAGRRLGHRRVSVTNRYAHLDDTILGQAAERAAVAIVRKLHRHANHTPESCNGGKK
ncbi:MAG: tyrosine-type recombinase/integrase [Rhodobacteraceae bacterium]|nr:tyrosine-type recombinase/integrase [Paracoccaceae bacterium]